MDFWIWLIIGLVILAGWLVIKALTPDIRIDKIEL